jgi:hypothetical protein
LVSVTPIALLVEPTVSLPKAMLVADRLAAAPALDPWPVAVPDKLTELGLLEALDVTVSVPVLVPLAVGAKVTLIAQLTPGASALLHVVVSA